MNAEAQRIAKQLVVQWFKREIEMQARPVCNDPLHPDSPFPPGYCVESPRSAAISRCREEMARAFGVSPLPSLPLSPSPPTL